MNDFKVNYSANKKSRDMIFPKNFLNLKVATVRELCIACIANINIAVGTIDHASSRSREA